MMRAMIFDDFGGNDRLHMADIPIPDPQKEEVLIHSAYAGVNPVDWKICEGWLKNFLKTKFPVIPGWDVAGIVSKVGDGVTKFKEGDKVYSYCRNPDLVHMGSYAEYVCCNAESVALIPKSLGLKEAASIPLVGLTVWQSLFGDAALKPGQSILIHAGAGGVGSLAIQLAKWAGAKVYTTASEKNHDYVKQLGADVAIDYHNETIEDVMAKYEPNGFDLVYDCVGDKVFDKSLNHVKKGGWLMTICKFVFDESLERDHGIHIKFVFVQPNGQELTKITQLFDEGALKVLQLMEFSLEEATKSWEQLRTEHTRGKIVLKI